ncbi:uncharacterized protein JCM6883_002412 [Sporobolomyces salmoneus]|uniref:uncharacterized protein n=1 Tax=Sporobolomyces salmoneus TaxID=183962 RepID=UPI00316B0C6F
MFTRPLTRSTRLLLSLPHPTSSPLLSSPLRLASSVAAADLPRAPPHDKIPFSAPPKDETRGDLGQVHLPDMTDRKIEPIALKIPAEPDSYRTNSKEVSSSESQLEEDGDQFPTMREPKVHTVSAKETYHGGGPSVAANSADDTFEAFEGDHKLAAQAQAQSQSTREDGKEKEHGHHEKGGKSHSHSSSKGKGKGDHHQFEGKALNEEERKGLYKLGGILVAGWVLGGLTRPYRPQHPEKEKKVEV